MGEDDQREKEPRGGGGAGVQEISCEEALSRLYEYLDGELEDVEAEEVRRHLEICKKCYPLFNFERLFLDFIRDRGGQPVRDERLRDRVREMLEGLDE